MARLGEGVSVGQAQTEMDLLTSAMAQEYPKSRSYYEHANLRVVPVSEDATGELRHALSILFGAVAVVMLIVCSNVANLLLGRVSSRMREMALRASIGAGRRRLVRQLLTESLVLALAGGAAGFALAHLLVDHFQSVLPKSDWGVRLVQSEWIRIDTTAALFAAGVAVASGLIFGIVPALRASGANLNVALKDAGNGSVGSRKGPGGRGALVMFETALAVVLVCCAGLLVRSFVALYQKGPGFQTEKRIWVQISPQNIFTDQRRRELREQSQSDYRAAFREKMEALYAHAERMRKRIASLPGVRDVAINTWPVMTSSDATNELWVHRDGKPTNVPCEVAVRNVSPNYFALMGIPVLEGRGFGKEDRWGAPSVMAVSQQAARACGFGVSPIGSECQLSEGRPRGPRHRVTAVVGDVRDEGVEREPLAVVYRPFAQGGDPWFSLLVHADSDPAGLVPSIKEAIREVDSGEHPTFFYQVRSLEELMRDSAWKLNYSTMMLGALAGLSLLLAAVGVYGVLNQAVHQRTREIGLRMAVGAAPSEVLRMVLREGFAVAGTGVVIGVIAAAGLTRFLGSLLYGVEPLDGFTFGLVSVVMLAVAFLASYLPALRATRVDPMVALRHE